jgi:hypothetical protein
LKALLIIVVLAVIAGSFYADYRWKRWIAKQREERERSREGFDDEFRR